MASRDGTLTDSDFKSGILSEMAEKCHAVNQHWWHDPATGLRLQRNRGCLLMLIVSEIAEAMEGERKDLMDDHLPHRKMAEVELADALIRIFDYCGAYKISLMISGDDLNSMALHYAGIRRVSSDRAEALYQIVQQIVNNHPREAINQILAYAGTYGYDMDASVAEKMAYNAQRADHKAAARLAEGGKKF